MNPLQELHKEGQSIWLDFIERSLMSSGKLQGLIDGDGLRGMTSNPTIFEKAITGGSDYDASIKTAVERTPDIDAKRLFETIAIEDIQMATEAFAPVYEATKGEDGYVSLEVSPELANETAATVAEAKRLWREVKRPNLMIKVPGTAAGVPAIEELTADGININVTLLFSLSQYEAIANAFIDGAKRCADPSKLASVASFFVSRVDGQVDKALDANGSPEALALRGKAAVANARIAYHRFEELFLGGSFNELKSKGTRVQRPLWASTSTKNPEYRDVLYVEELIGPHTVNTLPPATLDAFRDHGKVARTVNEGYEQAADVLKQLGALDIDLDAITDKLQVDGVASFDDSYQDLLRALKKKSAQS